jgi:uncharacterized protein (TIGR03084 family)
MATPFEEVIEDLQAEQAALESVLVRLPDSAWDIPTHAPGWAVRDQVAHLAAVDESATSVMRDPEGFRAGTGRVGAAGYLEKGRAMKPAQLLDWWHTASRALLATARACDPQARLPWAGPEMSATSFLTARLMETWSHGLDVVDVVGIERPPTDRLRHVVFLGMRTRAFSYVNRGLPPNDEPVRVELLSPAGGHWTYGDEHAPNRITGSAVDFAQVVTRRRHVADTDLVVEGAAAAEWMEIAQTFAGPPGDGRQPGEFPKVGSR